MHESIVVHVANSLHNLEKVYAGISLREVLLFKYAIQQLSSFAELSNDVELVGVLVDLKYFEDIWVVLCKEISTSILRMLN